MITIIILYGYHVNRYIRFVIVVHTSKTNIEKRPFIIYNSGRERKFGQIIKKINPSPPPNKKF